MIKPLVILTYSKFINKVLPSCLILVAVPEGLATPEIEALRHTLMELELELKLELEPELELEPPPKVEAPLHVVVTALGTLGLHGSTD